MLRRIDALFEMRNFFGRLPLSLLRIRCLDCRAGGLAMVSARIPGAYRSREHPQLCGYVGPLPAKLLSVEALNDPSLRR